MHPSAESCTYTQPLLVRSIRELDPSFAVTENCGLYAKCRSCNGNWDSMTPANSEHQSQYGQASTHLAALRKIWKFCRIFLVLLLREGTHYALTSACILRVTGAAFGRTQTSDLLPCFFSHLTCARIGGSQRYGPFSSILKGTAKANILLFSTTDSIPTSYT